MKILATFKKAGRLQRELISFNGRTYRRISALVEKNELVSLAAPIWQEQIHTGEFHNLVSRGENLEQEYSKNLNSIS